jgi:hypothetical protein
MQQYNETISEFLSMEDATLDDFLDIQQRLRALATGLGASADWVLPQSTARTAGQRITGEEESVIQAEDHLQHLLSNSFTDLNAIFDDRTVVASLKPNLANIASEHGFNDLSKYLRPPLSKILHLQIKLKHGNYMHYNQSIVAYYVMNALKGIKYRCTTKLKCLARNYKLLLKFPRLRAYALLLQFQSLSILENYFSSNDANTSEIEVFRASFWKLML